MVKELSESYRPQVGPFFIIDGVVFSDSEETRDIELSPIGTKDSSNNHFEYWSFMQRYYPEFRNIDYDYYPRGRVVYNSNDDTYYIYIDKCAMDSVEDVVSEFNIPRNKYVVKDDEHYKCHLCNDEYSYESMNYE